MRKHNLNPLRYSIVFEPLEGLRCVSETESHEQELPQAERRCYCRFRDVLFGDGDLMVGFNQVNF
jgi:hypothetical protein